MVEAVASRESFDLLEVWPWWENEGDPDREVGDLVLDCEWTGKERLSVEMLPGLIKLLPGADLENIYISVHGKDVGPAGSIPLAYIGFIHVMYFVEGKGLPVIEDDRLKIVVPGGGGSRDFPEGYSAHGSITPKPKPDYVPGRRKAHLTVVKGVRKPKRKHRKGVAAPKDVLKYAGKMDLRESWRPVIVQLYKRSAAKELKDVPHYPRATKRRGRYYFCGVKYLAGVSGVDERTLRRVLKDLIHAKLIYLRYRGYKGRGCSILELPPNIGLVKKWRREHKG
ncbi:hypothetical protein ES703_46927 [subsurface metagenome]